MSLLLTDADLERALRKRERGDHLAEFVPMDPVPAPSYEEWLRTEIASGEGTPVRRAWLEDAALRRHLAPT